MLDLIKAVADPGDILAHPRLWACPLAAVAIVFAASLAGVPVSMDIYLIAFFCGLITGAAWEFTRWLSRVP